MRPKRTLDPTPIEVAPDDLGSPIDLARLFGRGAAAPECSVELEIGSGKGTFLMQEAAARPDVCFLGVEVVRKYEAYAADRARRAGLDNVRTTYADAAELLRERLPGAALAAVHVYFPDPWPKQRHHKRRIVRPDLLPHFERVLAPGGTLRIVTDHPGYAEWIAEVLRASTLEPIPYEPPASAGPGETVGTNFERKYRVRDGRPFHAFALRRSRSLRAR